MRQYGVYPTAVKVFSCYSWSLTHVGIILALPCLSRCFWERASILLSRWMVTIVMPPRGYHNTSMYSLVSKCSIHGSIEPRDLTYRIEISDISKYEYRSLISGVSHRAQISLNCFRPVRFVVILSEKVRSVEYRFRLRYDISNIDWSFHLSISGFSSGIARYPSLSLVGVHE